MPGHRRFALLSPLMLAACMGAPPRAGLAAPQPVFRPEQFFAGNTHGDGELTIAVKGSHPVRVDGRGHLEPDGTLVLVQDIDEEGKHPRRRTWHIRPAGDGRYSGTLTDAKGPVSADVSGNTLHIAYTQPDGLGIEQWLYLQPGGQVALNRMSVTKWGVRIARLSETIRRVP